MARTFRLILCLAAGLWLVFVVRASRDVEVEVDPSGPRPQFPRPNALGPTEPRMIRPAITLDEGAAGEEMRRLRDHWQRAVLLR
jgi:hypothetical protein